MAPPSRRVAFSAKAKKKQLQNKREVNRERESQGDGDFLERRKKNYVAQHLLTNDGPAAAASSTEAINLQPGRGRNINRYNLKFHVETKEEIEARKELARQAIVPEPETGLELGTDFCFVPGLEFPQRPKWDYTLTQQMLDMKENKYFREYINEIEKTFPLSELSYFELNLETWRQLWRVLEMSDILLVVVDARFPCLLFPPSLYHYVSQQLKRDVILVFNKIDLVPAPVLAAWKNYFQTQFPLLRVVFFTSLPSYNLRGGERKTGLKAQRRKGTMKMAAEGALKLLEVCEDVCGMQVDLSAWRSKIIEEMTSKGDDEELEIGEVIQQAKKPDVGYHQQERFQSGMLTIGCVGQPNVGKSSLINALMGKKVVSVSRTPGHTKHFQTIFLTPNVKLCDCPGLVFPSKLPRTLQVLVGSYPIAHLREPYTAVGYIGKYLNLPELLKLEHPSGEKSSEGVEWSAYDICEGWAMKRGFMTKKAARPDVARAANHLLRLSLEGRISLYLRPPNYKAEESKWQSHPDVVEITNIQALGKNEDDGWLKESAEVDDAESDENEDESEDESEEASEDDVQVPASSNKFALLEDDD
ncbi:guanine nucleotide-binding protein-like 1 [Daphnia carinata]|uniref:guanine nucleotide-binding protein-like 1 n=1 Tax=Daphnia carinata TaxID=120202 RepID=UPI00257AAD3A|nr:guanine nucleotide-binding protein-like 1 [Daphnia carinata]